MNSKRELLISSHFIDNYKFFKSLIPIFQEKGYSPVFLTNKYSILKDCRLNGYRVLSVKKEKFNTSHPVPKSLESLTNTISNKSSEILFNSVISILETKFKNNLPDLIFIWSGIRIIDMAVSEFAKRNSIKTLYFELSNLGKKIFVDPEGTNANSKLFHSSYILNDFNLNENEYENWKRDYINSNLASFSVPQSKNTAEIDYKKNLLDLYGAKFYGLLPFEPTFSIEKLNNKLLNKHVGYKFDKVDLKNDKYYFFPMQVSDDAQILLNSKINNIEAIKTIASKLKGTSINLYVKPHPAERDFNYVNELISLKDEIGFKFINGNMFEIMLNAEKIFTINSTAGLQARILDKPVEFFGNTFYSKLDDNQIKKYIQSYLLPLDFWSSNSIQDSIYDKLIERSKI